MVQYIWNTKATRRVDMQRLSVEAFPVKRTLDTGIDYSLRAGRVNVRFLRVLGRGKTTYSLRARRVNVRFLRVVGRGKRSQTAR